MIRGRAPRAARERLLDRVIFHASTGCWEWQGATLRGYGQIGIGSAADGSRRIALTHRLAASIWLGFDLFSEADICHHCDNPKCCNPSHLFIGNALMNVHDCMAKGRDRKAIGDSVPNAKLNPDQVREIRKLRAEGMYIYKIAEKFGVSYSATKQLLDGRAWRHVR